MVMEYVLFFYTWDWPNSLFFLWNGRDIWCCPNEQK